MPAAKYNLKIEQGATFVRTLRFSQAGVAIDKSSKTFAGSIRATYDSVSVLASLDFDTSLALEGIIIAYLDATVTADLPSTKGLDPLVYDIEEYEDAEVNRILQGTVSVSPEVTKGE